MLSGSHATSGSGGTPAGKSRATLWAALCASLTACERMSCSSNYKYSQSVHVQCTGNVAGFKLHWRAAHLLAVSGACHLETNVDHLQELRDGAPKSDACNHVTEELIMHVCLSLQGMQSPCFMINK